MGNNWVNSIDPDGAWVEGEGFFRNLFMSDDRINSIRTVADNNGWTFRQARKNIDGLISGQDMFTHVWSWSEDGVPLVMNSKGQNVPMSEITRTDVIYWFASDVNLVALPTLTKSFSLFNFRRGGVATKTSSKFVKFS